LLKQRYSEEVLTTLGVGFDWGYPDNCAEWAIRYGLSYPIIDDSNLLLINRFTVPNIPFHVLIDHNSVIRYAAFGYDEQALRDTIDSMLLEVAMLDVKESRSLNLHQLELTTAYPNPFNGNITVGYKIIAPTTITASIINLAGETIVTLVDGAVESGSHKIVWRPQSVPSGIYIFRVKSAQHSRVQKIYYIK